jgi:hypothetical protein
VVLGVSFPAGSEQLGGIASPVAIVSPFAFIVLSYRRTERQMESIWEIIFWVFAGVLLGSVLPRICELLCSVCPKLRNVRIFHLEMYFCMSSSLGRLQNFCRCSLRFLTRPGLINSIYHKKQRNHANLLPLVLLYVTDLRVSGQQ